MTKFLSNAEVDRLFMQGDRDLHQGNLTSAIETFEKLYQAVDSNHYQYFNIQRSLVKAYQQNQQTEKAIALCQEMANSDLTATCLWGQKFLATLSPEIYQELLESQAKQEIANTIKHIPVPHLKSKTLSEFKQYCQANLLIYLKEIENNRRRTLWTILISAIICLIITWCFCLALFNIIRIDNVIVFYLYSLIIPALIWVLFCRGCIQVYGLNFKRNIIDNIIHFIDEGNGLSYASHLFLENKRQTIISFTRSQIFRDELEEPDFLEQEDCVYGTIGNTDIFFAEITVKKTTGSHLNQLELEDYWRKSVIFHGLFFEARFVKNFISRTFVVPNDIRVKTYLNNWRGEVISLEDPQFNRLFKVYGDNQIESRYLLSTNLMSRLVNFNQKSGQKIYLSFIDGFVYIAIPYRHNLFEPKLLTNMMSFTPLKEYFQDLQLMIGIVEDLNLNRRIWG